MIYITALGWIDFVDPYSQLFQFRVVFPRWARLCHPESTDLMITNYLKYGVEPAGVEGEGG